jgi:hypothetical protein
VDGSPEKPGGHWQLKLPAVLLQMAPSPHRLRRPWARSHSSISGKNSTSRRNSNFCVTVIASRSYLESLRQSQNENNRTANDSQLASGFCFFLVWNSQNVKEKRGQRTLASGGDVGRIVGPSIVANAKRFFALGLASGVSAAFHIFARSCKASFVNREKDKRKDRWLLASRDDRKPELFSLNQQKLKTHADGLIIKWKRDCPRM